MNREVGASRRKKALVFIDFDMVIRHFILSGAFRELEQAYDVKYVFHTDDTSPKQGIYTDVDALGLKNYSRFPIPRKRMGTWDPLYCATVLNNQRGTDNYKTRLELTYLTRSPKWVRRYEFLSLPGIFQIFRFAFSTAMGAYKPLSEFVKQESPDIVIHPTILQGYFINELVPICKKQNIPFLCLMNSWDNPSQKAAATGFPDKLVVWGEQTRRHAVDYMKMPPEDVLMFGAAQFQIYRKPVTESDAELRAAFKVPEGIPVLLYGGTSKGVMENLHLELIDAAIGDGRIPPCHVIYRPHPWRGALMTGERSFFDYDFRYITMDPFMEEYYRNATGGSAPGFDMADYDVTRKLLHLVEAVMSPLSTILLEAVMHQKPVQVLLDSETGSKISEGIQKLGPTVTHFADLKGPGITYCTDRNTIPEGCARLLEQAHDPEIRAALKKLGDSFAIMDGPTYAERLLALTDEMTGRTAMDRE